jgi:hypothetical protein
MNKQNDKQNNNYTIVIEINHLTIASFSILFILIIFGSFYLWKIGTRPVCYCKLCREEVMMLEKLSEGGFGEV